MSRPVRGVVLFAHGSRDPLWSQPVEAIAVRMRQLQPDVPVHCAYLELTTPDLETVVRRMVDGGARHITVLPMFLGVGRHARHDLPELVGEMTARYPQVRLELQPAIGEHPLVVDLIASIALAE